MKTKILLISILAALAMTFISCSEPGMIELDPDDITADWVEKGTWSGTISTTDFNGKTISTDVDHMKYTVAAVKTNFLKTGINLSVGSFDLDCRVYSNISRTKLLLKQTVTITAGDETLKKTLRWDFKKD